MNRCFNSDQGKVVRFSILFPERWSAYQTSVATQLDSWWHISACQRDSMSAQFGVGCWPLGFSHIRPILVDTKVFAQFWFQTPTSRDWREKVKKWIGEYVNRWIGVLTRSNQTFPIFSFYFHLSGYQPRGSKSVSGRTWKPLFTIYCSVRRWFDLEDWCLIILYILYFQILILRRKRWIGE